MIMMILNDNANGDDNNKDNDYYSTALTLCLSCSWLYRVFTLKPSHSRPFFCRMFVMYFSVFSSAILHASTAASIEADRSFSSSSACSHARGRGGIHSEKFAFHIVDLLIATIFPHFQTPARTHFVQMLQQHETFHNIKKSIFREFSDNKIY